MMYIPVYRNICLYPHVYIYKLHRTQVFSNGSITRWRPPVQPDTHLNYRDKVPSKLMLHPQSEAEALLSVLAWLP